MNTNKIALEALTDAKAAYEAWGNGTTKIDAAIAALEAMEAGGWLPIESSPKEGTFLVYTPTERESRRYQVMHRQKNFAVIGGIFAFDCDPPTHWMPLPTPPKD